MNRGIFVFVLLALVAACGKEDGPAAPSLDSELRDGLQSASVTPIAPGPAQNAALVDLGQALFFDKILSGNRDVSCATCHLPAATLGDGLSLSIGTGGTGAGPTRTLGVGREFVPRNSPSLLNVGFLGAGSFAKLFWDARVRLVSGSLVTPAGPALPPDVTDVLTAQAMFPVASRREMRGEVGDPDRYGSPNELAAFGDTQFVEIWQAIMQRLLVIPDYVTKFSAAFPGTLPSDLHFHHAASAIAAFEKQAFITINSPFDRYVLGDNAALTFEQKRGGVLFFGTARCGGCHFGTFLGGIGFANIGTPQLGPGVGVTMPPELDEGGFTQGFGKFAFRVPPLRNVELTAPYMHNGAYATLEAAVRHYNDVVFAQQFFDETQLAPVLQGRVHRDPATIAAVSATLGPGLPPTGSLADSRVVDDLVAFLKSLTDPAARDLSSLVPASVPSGLPIAD